MPLERNELCVNAAGNPGGRPAARHADQQGGAARLRDGFRLCLRLGLRRRSRRKGWRLLQVLSALPKTWRNYIP